MTKYFCLLTLLITLPVHAASVDSTVLTFEEREPVVPEPYTTRMLLTADHIRMDDGGDTDDFVLFDRKTNTIYSVSHEDERVVIIEPSASEIPQPDGYQHESRVVESELPAIGGKDVMKVQHFTNGEMCMEVYAVDGLLADAADALASFALTLAHQHGVTMAEIPAEFQSACDLANNVYLPTRYLENGFPVRQRDYLDRSRALQSFRENVKKDQQLFVIPGKYQLFYPGKTPI